MSSVSDPTPLHTVDAPAAASHDGQEHHEGLAHISPWQTLVWVWVVLMALTILTVMATWVNLGTFNILIALGIAVIKGTLVVMYFMHLKFDRAFNVYVFTFCLAFAAFFIGMLMLDTKHYATTVEKRRLDEEKVKAVYTPPPAQQEQPKK
jgi:cytochrome c oxidase subunit 4